MSHTHSRLLYHIIWATKNRENLILPAAKSELHSYIVSLLAKHGGPVYAVNGTRDHVHCVCQLGTDTSLSKVLQDVKAYSSGWMKRKWGVRQFAWQQGYAPFTISPSNLDQVIAYVRNQEEHHRTKSFSEEYAQFLCAHGIELPEWLASRG